MTIIWTALDEAEKELEKPRPDSDKLAKIGRLLINALRAVAAYCGALADVALKTSVKTASASATALTVATQHERLHTFGQALLQFARRFGN